MKACPFNLKKVDIVGDKEKVKDPDKDQKSYEIEDFLVKRCPECFVNLSLDAKECFSCHSKVGNVDKHGKAKRGIDWTSYIVCIISWGILIFYIKWAFLS